MDCGIPFCHQGCPLGNLIPDWNDLVYRDRWQAAIERLLATNNFPGVHRPALPGAVRRRLRARHQQRPGHHQGDRERDHRARVRRGLDRAAAARASRSGKRIAVVGSGPAGLAAADQLNKAGHWVTVFERADRIGGLLRYGIPEFKMEKRVLDRRLAVMDAEGVKFRTNANIGGGIPADELRREFDAVVLCGGATIPRDLPIPGRQLSGIHFAMDYLTQQNRRCEGDDLGRRAADHRRGQARRHHRRRRHRRRLPGHRASAGRAFGPPVRAAAQAARRARRRATPGRSGRRSSVSRPRTRKAASASTRCRPPSSSATATDACRA